MKVDKKKKAEVDSNKQYVSELLAILMHSSEANQQKLANIGGIETILQAIAVYKNRCGYCVLFSEECDAQSIVCEAIVGTVILTAVRKDLN